MLARYYYYYDDNDDDDDPEAGKKKAKKMTKVKRFLAMLDKFWVRGFFALFRFAAAVVSIFKAVSEFFSNCLNL